MKPTLQFRLQQQLALTPQLQQAIKLLQLSSQELETQLIEALETNPLLERGEFSEANPDSTDSPAGTEASEVTGQEVDSSDLDAPAESLDADYEHTLTASVSSASSGASDRQQEIANSTEQSLGEHLLWQLQMNFAEPLELAVGAAVIDAIDHNGYLSESPAQIQQTLGDDHGDQVAAIESMILAIQQFDPIGVGARDMQHCLLIQLGLMRNNDPTRQLAIALVRDHLESIARQAFEPLYDALSCDHAQLMDAVALIRTLEPRPGSQFNIEATEYIRPDVIVERNKDGQWAARLHDEFMPRLKINDFYTNLLKQTKGSDADYLRNQMTEARWLLRSLETRNDTIFRVANAIVAHQQQFLEHGPEYMKPLVLREIAEAVELHESTVSRVTTRKYMLTPRGVFEFKYFFSSHVGTRDGGEASATAVQAMIRKLIDEEPVGKPLSDAKLTAALGAKGIEVARRTVAKYREAMNIESSSKRRRLL